MELDKSSWPSRNVHKLFQADGYHSYQRYLRKKDYITNWYLILVFNNHSCEDILFYRYLSLLPFLYYVLGREQLTCLIIFCIYFQLQQILHFFKLKLFLNIQPNYFLAFKKGNQTFCIFYSEFRTKIRTVLFLSFCSPFLFTLSLTFFLPFISSFS